MAELYIKADDFCPSSAAFFGMMGAACAIVFCNLGAAYGTAKAGVGVCHLAIMDHKLIIKGLVPCVMAGILGIYGLIISVLIVNQVKPKNGYSGYKGYAHLSAGLSTGLSSLAGGMAIGIVGDAGVRAYGKQSKVYTGLLLIMIFSEALALYGLIVGLLTSNIPGGPKCPKVENLTYNQTKINLNQ